MGKAIVNMTGQRYGMLTVIKMHGSKNGHATWLCKCDCGNEKIIIGNSLRTGRTRSCGCIAVAVAKAYPHRAERIEAVKKAHTRHGMTASKLHYVWVAMKQRCTNPKQAQYKNYGGRGISVCAEWLNSFEAFYDHVSQLPHFGEKGRSLDRINNNGNYEPGNVRWATAAEQTRNRRCSKNGAAN